VTRHRCRLLFICFQRTMRALNACEASTACSPLATRRLRAGSRGVAHTPKKPTTTFGETADPNRRGVRLPPVALGCADDDGRHSKASEYDVHAPRSYMHEYSTDGDGEESYSLSDAKDGFGPAEGSWWNNWGESVSTKPHHRDSGKSSPFFDASGVPESDAPEDDLDHMDVITATSTHTRHPHVVSIKLPRPISNHIKFEPQRPPPQSNTFGELRVRFLRLSCPSARSLFSFGLRLNALSSSRQEFDFKGLDLEPTGAVVTDVNPRLPGLAFGVIQPGDVLACLADEWKHPVQFFVRQEPFSKIERALFEEGPHPVTLRFERYIDAETESIDRQEFIGSHEGDRTSVKHSHLT